MDLLVVADLCTALAELAETRPATVAMTARKLASVLRWQHAKRAA